MLFKTKSVGPVFAERARRRFTYDMTVRGKPQAVFDAITDPAQLARWFPDYRGARWVTEAPHGVGSVREVKLRGLGVLERILIWEPGERFVFRISRLSVPLVSKMVEDYRITDIGRGKCRVQWTIAYQPKLPLLPMHRTFRPLFGRMFQRGSESLTKYLAQQSGRGVA